MSLAIVIIKSKGIGDLCILISNIHAISQKIHSQVTILAQKSTNARAIFKNDPHVKEVIELNDIEIKSFFVGANVTRCTHQSPPTTFPISHLNRKIRLPLVRCSGSDFRT